MRWSSVHAAFAKSAVFIVAVASSTSFRRDNDDDVQWVRLCTLTSDDSGSVFNVTMPCSVQVRGESTAADVAENQHGGGGGGRNNAGTVDVDDRVTAVQAQDVVRLPAGGHNATIDRGGGGVGTLDGELHADNSGQGTPSASDGDCADVTVGDKAGLNNFEAVNPALDNDGDEYDDGDDDDDDDGVTVVAAPDDGDEDIVSTPPTRDHNVDGSGSGDETAEGLDAQGAANLDGSASDGDHDTVVQVQYERDDGHQRREAVTKVVLTYIQEAKSRLYNKIHNLLSFLQHAYFNATFNQRIRRNLVARQMSVNERRLRNKKKQPFSSMIMQPTFERSMMTMSFLMFGVFVIQVIQRLMQTLQQSGEMASMGNSIISSLPKILANIH